MKWFWILIIIAAPALSGYSAENLPFPFNRATRITFIRLGDQQADAGQQFVLRYDPGQWSVERRIKRSEKKTTEISQERAEEILAAFAGLYSHWQERPLFNDQQSGYSLYIAINDVWRISMNVKDRGSPALARLLEEIAYPDGVTLGTAEDDKTPGIIRASSESSTADKE